MNRTDLDASVDTLDHVVDRQRGDRNGSQGFHLDPGWTNRGGLGANPQRAGSAIRGHGYDEIGQGDRMTERNEIRGALAAHDAGQLGDRQYVALWAATIDHEAQGLLGQPYDRLGDGPPGGCRFLAHVDHPGPPGPIDVRQAAPVGSSFGRVEERPGRSPRRRRSFRAHSIGTHRSSHQSSTSVPASTPSTSSGMMARASAAASALMT